MKAMILAAGLGTRLRPLTNDRPKALAEVGGRTLLEITLRRLGGFGVRDVIVNVHHFADMVEEYLRANNNFGMRIEISREEILLDTGGGLMKAADFFLRDGRDEPFVLHNVDVLSAIDLAKMVQAHRSGGALVTLAVQARASSRYLLFDEHGALCGRRTREAKNASPARGALAGDIGDEMVREARQTEALAFCGVHVISPGIFARRGFAAGDGPEFPIIPAYLRLAAEGERIAAFRADEYYWRDLGTLASLKQAANDLEEKVVEQ